MIDSPVNECANLCDMSLSHRPIFLSVTWLIGATTLTQSQALDLSLDPEFANAAGPAVTIQDHANRTTEEYRVNGNLYMIKVNPAAGPSYYLVDPDGSGEFEWRRNTPTAAHSVPQWALFKW